MSKLRLDFVRDVMGITTLNWSRTAKKINQ